MKVKNIILNKPIQIYNEKNQFILVKDNITLSLSKINGNAKPIKDHSYQSINTL